MWWTNVVRIRIEGEVGTGVYVAPDRVLTARHVVQSSTGLAEPSSVRVIQMHAPSLSFVASGIVPCPGFDNAPASRDLCLLIVPPLVGAGLDVRLEFANDGNDAAVAVYGYPANPPDPASPGAYLQGSVRRAADAFTSEDLFFAPGVSGAPLLIDVQGNVLVVGIATSRSTVPGQRITVGLPLLQSTFGAMNP